MTTFETPVLSLSEQYSVKNVLENRLTDALFLGAFTVHQFTASLVMATSGGTENVEVVRWVEEGAGEGWSTTQVACRAVSLGAIGEQRNNSAFYVQRMRFQVSLDEALSIPQAPYVEISGGTHDGKYVTAIQGTWIAYDGVVYRIDGATVSDTMPTLMLIDAKQDSFTKDTAMTLDATWTAAYLYAGSAIAANTTVPSNPKLLMTSTAPPIALGANGAFIRTK